MALTPRGTALRFLKEHRGIKEIPAGSNTDNRPNSTDGRWGIRKAQLACAGGATWLVGTPWCGEWARWALQHAGVQGLTSRLASVALIEQDARAHRPPFFDWRERWDWRTVHRGDLVVMFGRGVHVETVRSFKRTTGGIIVITEGGNTSSGNVGDQANGGGAFRRERALSDVFGFARVNYPGGRLRALPSVALPGRALEHSTHPADRDNVRVIAWAASDEILLKALAGSVEARGLVDEVARALDEL